MKEIVAVHYPGIKEEVLRAAMDTFFALRDAPGLKKKPSTSEFLDWLRLLVNEAVSAKDISSTAGDLPLMAGALLKNEQDLTLLQRLARSEEHTSELQSLMRISYAVFCLKKKTHR